MKIEEYFEEEERLYREKNHACKSLEKAAADLDELRDKFKAEFGINRDRLDRSELRKLAEKLKQ